MDFSTRNFRLLLATTFFCTLFSFLYANEIKDTRQGEDITLECRFSPHIISRETLTYYWAKNNRQTRDNVAIGNVSLDNNYRLNYQPENGIYDLFISNANYDRDNGKFECKVRAVGSGNVLHTQVYTLIVLTAPQEPAIAPGAHVTVTEGKRQELTCSSVGGSPDPQVKWYREGSTYPLDAALKNGESREQPTTATLSIIPSKEDDGAVFTCEVWNRALPDDKKLTASVSLSVNYFPRVEVGPENPLRAERDSQVTLECTVDSKPKVSTVRWTRNGRFISSYNNHLIHRVSIQDAGKYTCSADNGLGKVGEKEILLDVLYAPVVTLEAKTQEAEEGESVNIKCNVSANPAPIQIEWIKEGKPEFRQSGEILRLNHVTAENSGTYTCRAVNVINPSPSVVSGVRLPNNNGPNNNRGTDKIGNASIALLIRHKPGEAVISPDKPVVSEGGSVTLTCTATPPGWPAPQYKWFRTADQGQPKILATGTKYTITNANLGTEGIYNCQAANELGPGIMASVNLEVHQPPSFKYQLKPLETKKVGTMNFYLSCGARGKPRPVVKWLKDGEELKADINKYEVKTEYSDAHNGAVDVQSMLKFSGKARPQENAIMPSDRGVYTCSFENEVKKSESSTHLKIEHLPIVQHQYDKVAYDLYETAEVICKVLSYPKPEFKWYYGTNMSPLQSSSEGHYVIHNNVEDDVYTSILRISKIQKQDYGDYNCHIVNNMGTITTKIKLQPKGPPEQPKKLVALHVGYNFVTLGWEPGFNGGIANTKYFVSYKKVPNENNDILVEGCGMVTKSADWSEVDCQQNIPCNVSHLDQHQTYLFKVKALNTKGNSDSSEGIRVVTRVDRIPIPQRVAYEPSSHILSINTPATCLPLLAVIELVDNERIHNEPIWQPVDTLTLSVSGFGPTYKEIDLDKIGFNQNNLNRNFKGIGRSIVDYDEPIGMNERYATPRVRVKLCLRTRPEHCGDYIEAELGSAYIREASALNTPTLIAIVICCIVLILFISLFFIFCKCKRNQSKKQQQSLKDYEMDSIRPTVVPPTSHHHQQNQAPPPYYPPVVGMENKALEHSLDLQLAMDDDDDDQKNIYGTHHQNGVGGGYGYHHMVGNHGDMQLQGRQNMTNNDWANMGYLENSYSNSQNGGGSVNSQDSLWQMKMGGNGGPPTTNSTGSVQQQLQQPLPHHNNLMNAVHMDPNNRQQQQQQQQQNTYGYDPITHGGYGAVDDYAPYPHLTTTPSNHGNENDYGTNMAAISRQSQNPSRQQQQQQQQQDYGGQDPYAAVHKPKKRIEQHVDSPYHDVSGLPDPYLEQLEDEKPPQHMSLNYEESLESGYSTPNSRTRRVIREIIV